MGRTERWQFTFNQSLEQDINVIETQFQELFGRKPSKSQIMEILLTNTRNKKMKMTRRKKVYFI